MKPEQEPKYKAVPVGTMGGDEARIVNRASGEFIPDDEPIFILRGRDIHAYAAIVYYARLVQDQEHEAVVLSRAEDFGKFSMEHPERMHEPTTKLEDLEL